MDNKEKNRRFELLQKIKDIPELKECLRQVEGPLDIGVEYDSYGGNSVTVLQLNNDETYGSDFYYMLHVIYENITSFGYTRPAPSS